MSKQTQYREMLPQALDAEENVIGLLLNSGPMELIADWLQPEHFYRPLHQRVYEAMQALFASGRVLSYLTVNDALARRDVEIETDYLANLSSRSLTGFQSLDTLEAHARLIYDAARKRGLYTAGTKIASVALSAARADEVQALAESTVLDAQMAGTDAGFVPLATVMQSCQETLRSLQTNAGALVGMPTGFAGLDKLIGGFRRKRFYLAAGRPGMGKTSFALHVAHHAAMHQRLNVGVLSLEMPREELGERLIAMEAGIDNEKVHKGDLTELEFRRVQAASMRLADIPLYIDDLSGTTIAELRSRARRLQAKHGIDLLIVDYLQLMHGDTTPSDNEVQELTMISRALKELAKSLDVPVLSLAQLSRKVEERSCKIPMPSDLRGSGSLEQDADVLLFLYREEFYNANSRPGEVDIIVAKQRQGALGTVVAGFAGGQFRDVQPEALYG